MSSTRFSYATDEADTPGAHRHLLLFCPDPAEQLRVAEIARLLHFQVTPVSELVGPLPSDAELFAAVPNPQGVELDRLESYLTREQRSAIVAVPLHLLDETYARLGTFNVRFLVDPTDADVMVALTHPHDRRLREPGRGEVPLHQISDKLAEVARALALLAEQGRMSAAEVHEPPRTYDAPTSAGSVEVTAAEIRKHIRRRRLRDDFFDPRLFADPAWDILLDLMANRLDGIDVSVSSLCIAAAVPPTTALRWIRVLTEAGIVERRADPDDARRVFIGLSDKGADAMLRYCAAVLAGE